MPESAPPAPAAITPPPAVTPTIPPTVIPVTTATHRIPPLSSVMYSVMAAVFPLYAGAGRGVLIPAYYTA